MPIALQYEEKPTTITLDNDNMQTVDMIQALGATKRSEFMYTHHQYIKQTVKEKNIKLKHKEYMELKVDIFAKPLERTRYEKIRKMIDVDEIPNIEQDVMTEILRTVDLQGV